MIVDGPGGAPCDRADSGPKSTSGYGSNGRAAASSDSDTPDGPANVMMTTVNSAVVAMVIVVRCVRQSGRHERHD